MAAYATACPLGLLFLASGIDQPEHMVDTHAQHRHLYTMMHTATSVVLHPVDGCYKPQSIVQVPTPAVCVLGYGF